MTDDELTTEEKTRLLAVIDGKNTNNYDREFYEAMCQIKPLEPGDVDSLVLRAILRFIMDSKGIASQNNNGGLVMMGFIHGYQVGRKRRKDIRRRSK